MLNIDIEEFVRTGSFGPLGTNPTREMVHTLLGPPDTDGYPEHDQYGNVAFEFDDVVSCINRIMVAYPHPLNEDYFRQSDEWPDSRFAFTPGRFALNTKFRDVVNTLPNFEHADMIGDSPHRICVYTNRRSNIDLCFAPSTPLADHTLYCIVSHRENITSNSAG